MMVHPKRVRHVPRVVGQQCHVPATDKPFSPPPSDHIQQNAHLHTRHNHVLVSDQPLGRSNPSVTVIPLKLSSGSCASESLGHTGFDPPSLSEH